MIVGSTKEDLIYRKKSFDARNCKKYYRARIEVNIEKDYASHLGIQDDEYTKVGVKN